VPCDRGANIISLRLNVSCELFITLFHVKKGRCFSLSSQKTKFLVSHTTKQYDKGNTINFSYIHTTSKVIVYTLHYTGSKCFRFYLIQASTHSTSSSSCKKCKYISTLDKKESNKCYIKSLKFTSSICFIAST
jgi:hypothetical protein